MTKLSLYVFVVASYLALAATGCHKQAESPPPETPPIPASEPAPAKDAAATPDAPWHTYHGDFSLSGAAKTDLPSDLALAWRFMAAAPVITTPVAGNGRIYFANTKGRIFALDPQGNELWSTTIPREARDKWSPTEQQFDAPLVYFRETLLAGSLDGILFGLDAASGAVKWQTDLDGTILGSANVALVADATGEETPQVYVIEQGSGVLHCIDFGTGKPVWQSEGVERCDGSPGIGGGHIVFGSCAAQLHIFSAETGKLLRNIPVGDESQIAGGVAVLGNEAYSGSRSGNVLKACTDSGEIEWSNADCTDEVFTTPAVNDDWVVAGCANGDVHGLKRDTGESRWTYSAGGLVTSPVIAGNRVIVGADGALFLLNLDDGHKLWSYEVSDEITSPAVYGGLVIVGSDDGTVVAFR